MKLENEILAFVHIEKAAGTTLNHILRSNFLFRHADVRPLRKESGNNFTKADFELYLRLNPILKSISGHSVQPHLQIENSYSNIRYITVLRDPAKRYLSNFVYWREKLQKDITFEQYLDREDMKDFQTKKIVASSDFEKAKQVLTHQFFLVGIVEQFDKFLVLLEHKLHRGKFNPAYIKQNVSRPNSELIEQLADLEEKYKHRIIENNRVDIQLYEYVKTNLFLPECSQMSSEISTGLNNLQNKSNLSGWHVKRWLDYAYRKFYLDAFSGMIRILNGKPYKGSY